MVQVRLVAPKMVRVSRPVMARCITALVSQRKEGQLFAGEEIDRAEEIGFGSSAPHWKPHWDPAATLCWLVVLQLLFQTTIQPQNFSSSFW